jgi:hypothetical protein
VKMISRRCFSRSCVDQAIIESIVFLCGKHGVAVLAEAN